MSFSHFSLPVGGHYTAMRDFYAMALKPLGYEIKIGDRDGEEFVGLGTESTGPHFWLGLGASNKSLPKYDGVLANRVAPIHVAFNATSKEQVDEWYQCAMYDTLSTAFQRGKCLLTTGPARRVVSIMGSLESVNTLWHFTPLLSWIRWETTLKCYMVR
jgi:hypothetical protein